jgi:hypothetical protein
MMALWGCGGVAVVLDAKCWFHICMRLRFAKWGSLSKKEILSKRADWPEEGTSFQKRPKS